MGLEGTGPIPTYFVLCSSLLSAIFQNPFPHLLEHGQPDLLSLPPFSSLPFLMIIFLLTSSKSQTCKTSLLLLIPSPFLVLFTDVLMLFLLPRTSPPTFLPGPSLSCYPLQVPPLSAFFSNSLTVSLWKRCSFSLTLSVSLWKLHNVTQFSVEDS